MATTSDPLKVSDDSGRVVLRDVPWEVYECLRSSEANRHVRMTYLRGTLELMSPRYRHEKYAHRLARLVMAVVEELDIPCACAGSTTFRRPEDDLQGGAGK